MKQIISSVFIKRKKYYIFLLTFFLAVACNQPGKGDKQSGADSRSNGKSDTTTETKGTDTLNVTASGLKGNLHGLYLTKRDVNTLISSFPDGRFPKLVLTFVFPEYALDGSPTLATWPSQNRHQPEDYPNRTPLILHYGMNSLLDIPKNLFLSNLQLSVDRQVLKNAIERNAACRDKCVLYFSPNGNDTLSYDIRIVPDSNLIINRLAPDTSFQKTIPAVARLNPSPPRGSF